MPYDPVEDIPNIDKVSADAVKSDEIMRRVVTSARFALTKSSNLKKTGYYKGGVVDLLRDQLLMFTITHTSIREIVGRAYKYKYYPIIGDALSLTREQIEKIFIVATLLDNPDKAFKQYMRASWKTEYEEYLLQTEEHAENERFEEFLKETLPKRLDERRFGRKLRWRRETIVSKFAARALKFGWDNPGAKNPTWFKRKQSVRDYVRDYFEFATPGKSARRISDPNLRRFLYRWHKEYTYLSQFTHVTIGKMRFSNMHYQKSLELQEPIKRFGEESAIRAIHTSYTAIASACAIALNGVSNTYGAKDELREFWDQLTGFSLLSKALWKMHVEKILS